MKTPYIRQKVSYLSRIEVCMRLTRAGEYAVRCIIYLAKKGKGVLARRQEIADYGEIPPQFLAKIAQQLAREGIIDIKQGAKGGCRLLIPPEELTLLRVVEAIIGEIYLNDCIMRPDICRASSSCAVNRVWMRARNQLRRTLQEVTFADLLAEESCCVRPLPSDLNGPSPGYSAVG